MICRAVVRIRVVWTLEIGGPAPVDGQGTYFKMVGDLEMTGDGSGSGAIDMWLEP